MARQVVPGLQRESNPVLHPHGSWGYSRRRSRCRRLVAEQGFKTHLLNAARGKPLLQRAAYYLQGGRGSVKENRCSSPCNRRKGRHSPASPTDPQRSMRPAGHKQHRSILHRLFNPLLNPANCGTLVPGDGENKGLEADVPAAQRAWHGSDAGADACCLCRGCRPDTLLLGARLRGLSSPDENSCQHRAASVGPGTRAVAAGDGFFWSARCPQVCLAKMRGGSKRTRTLSQPRDGSGVLPVPSSGM